MFFYLKDKGSIFYLLFSNNIASPAVIVTIELEGEFNQVGYDFFDVLDVVFAREIEYIAAFGVVFFVVVG